MIHWKGGAHTQFEMSKPIGGSGQRTSLDDLDIIRKMAVRYGDDEIAYVLSKLGRRTGKDKPWNQDRVGTARRHHSIDGQKRTKVDPDILSLAQAAKYAGVSSATIKKLVSVGVLKRTICSLGPVGDPASRSRHTASQEHHRPTPSHREAAV